jgi:hypothetical protein
MGRFWLALIATADRPPVTSQPELRAVDFSRVALGDFSPRAPSDPCVRTLAHTVPLMTDSPCSKLHARTAILGR